MPALVFAGLFIAAGFCAAMGVFIAVGRVRHRGKNRWAAELPSPAQMQQILRRERGRVDRLGEMFSFIVFTPRSPKAQEPTVTGLLQALEGRLRLTDVAGWFDKERLGVVLPGTSAQGAWRFADNLCARLPDAVPPPKCLVYTYPIERPQNGAGPEKDKNETSCCPALSLATLFLRPIPVWKRSLDIIGALAGLTLLLPVLAAVAVAIKLSSRGPIFFCQWRTGRGGKPFVIYKFRTMTADAEARKSALVALNERDGPAFKITKDPRVTWLGRLLRVSSLDELPQLWNILKGDMCLVGPRPLPCDETKAFELWHYQRLDVQPGLTCIWQVRGRGGVAFVDWIRMDLQYIREQSLIQDLKLLVQTVPAVLLRRGAH